MNINDLPVTHDWHKHGIYAVLDPQGEPVTLETTPYSARAQFVRDVWGRRWSAAVEAGYRIVELTPTAVIETLR